MTIKVFESIMPGDPAEVYNDHGMTVESWIKSRTKDYRRGSVQPVSCMVNGSIVAPTDWAETVILEADVVEFRPVPRGDLGGALGFILPFWSVSVAAVNAAIQSFVPDIPGQRGSGQQGRGLAVADARANTARLGDGAPELLGRYIRYPDYLNEPRRFYQDTKTQVLRLLLGVSVGKVSYSGNEVRIGDTPFGDIPGASYRIYDPGADLSGDPNHENWYNAPEVGATSSASGIRLKGVTYDERTFTGSTNAFEDQMTPVPHGNLWTVGISGSIKMTQSILVEGAANAVIFKGAFQHLAQGMTVNVESNAGVNGAYVVTTINPEKTEITLETTGGVPVDNATVGSRSMSIDKAGTRYILTSLFGGFSIRVARQLANGNPDPDWTGELPNATVNAEIIWDASTFVANRSGPFVVCPAGETTDQIEVDIFAPSGLGTVDGESINSRSRTIRIEWREVGSTGAWSEQTQTVSGNTRDQLGWTFTVNLPAPIRAEVRVSRPGAEDVSVTALDRLEFTALKCKLPTVTSYPWMTVMSVTVSGSDEISSNSNNKINLIPTRHLAPVPGGPETATRSIARAAAYVAKSLGYEIDQLGVEEFERLDSLWGSRGDTFDFVISDGTAKDAIDMILRAGFAEMTLDNGAIVPVRDEPRTQFEQGYSPENMTAPLQRTFTSDVPDEPDGVEVEYTDGNTWTKETVLCLLPGDEQIKLEKVQVDGVVDRTRAWRIGMRRRRAQRYRRWTYNFNTELDALNSQYLSYVPLLDDIPGYGKVAILTGIQADRITVSEPLEWEDGKSHVIAYRDENGDTVGPFPATPGPDAYTVLVEIPDPWPAVLPSDREQTHVYFGTTERWCFPALITEISPSGPLQVGVTATNYDDRVYNDDSNSPS